MMDSIAVDLDLRVGDTAIRGHDMTGLRSRLTMAGGRSPAYAAAMLGIVRRHRCRYAVEHSPTI